MKIHISHTHTKMEGKCWNCGKMNEERPDGYFWCSCKAIKGSGNIGLSYLPMEVVILRRELARVNNGKLFLDDEEKINPQTMKPKIYKQDLIINRMKLKQLKRRFIRNE